MTATATPDALRALPPSGHVNPRVVFTLRQRDYYWRRVQAAEALAGTLDFRAWWYDHMRPALEDYETAARAHATEVARQL